jgi:hypothetical protein
VVTPQFTAAQVAVAIDLRHAAVFCKKSVNIFAVLGERHSRQQLEGVRLATIAVCNCYTAVAG